MRKRAAENSKFLVQQKLGDKRLTVSDLKLQLENGDLSAGKKILYFGANLRGTSQYGAQRARALRASVQFKINQGCGLPSFFSTGSYAEFLAVPRRLFCFGSLVILDVARCYLWLFTLYINIKISKNSC